MSRALADDRVLVLWCPDWPTVAVGADPGEPAAVVTAGAVVAATAAARALGVRRGQRVRDAQRRCPDLIVSAADPAAEVRYFEQVVTAIEGYCPRIEVLRPGLTALPLRGPARYFGGEQEAADVIRSAVSERGFHCATGAADGAFAAILAARQPPAGIIVAPGRTPQFLAPRPIADLGRPDLAAALLRLGIPTLGAFAALPASDVLTRFGPDGAQAHRLASGTARRPVIARTPEPDLGVEIVFDPPSDAEPVVFAARRLAEDLHAGLAVRGLVCEQVEIVVVTATGQRHARRWRHAGLLSAAALAERVRWQIDAWRAGGSPDGAIVGLRLEPDQLGSADGAQGALWGRSAVDEQVDRAATRIQEMLGHDAVTRPHLAGGRGPAERIVRVSWGDDGVPVEPSDRPWPGRLPAPAPAVVLTVPRQVEVTDDEGRPVVVSARCVVSAPPAFVSGLPDTRPQQVSSWTGPWPAHERWWDPTSNRRRARFQATTADGRAWLLMVEDGTWWVEAGYD